MKIKIDARPLGGDHQERKQVMKKKCIHCGKEIEQENLFNPETRDLLFLLDSEGFEDAGLAMCWPCAEKLEEEPYRPMHGSSQKGGGL